MGEEARFIRLGSWQLQPRVELSESYDSNVYATPSQEEDDFITRLTPTVRLQSDWSVHQVVLEAGADLGWYQDFSDEDYQDYYLRNSNRIEVLRGNNILTDVILRHGHEARSSPNDIGLSEEPLPYDDVRGSLGYEHSIGVVSLLVDVAAERVTYGDTDAIGGGTLDNSYYDRDVREGGIKLTYAREQTSQAYFSARLIETDYDDSTLGGRADRDSSGYNLALGIKKNLSDIWVLDAYVGYSPRSFSDSSLEDISGADAIAFGAKALWNPTRLTSVIGNFDRTTYETTEAGASLMVHTMFALRAEHKLTESLVVDANLGYAFDDYVGSDREDDIYTFGLGAAYYFTKLFSVRAGYNYFERSSSLDFDDYTKHLATVQFRVNY